MNAQNNLVDEQWFIGRMFSNIHEMMEKATADKIAFPDDRQHTWQKYVDAQRLEISWRGSLSGKPLRHRNGETIYFSANYLLDRKLHVVVKTRIPKKNVHMDKAGVPGERVWLEYQAISLLLAGENLFVTFRGGLLGTLCKLPHLR